MASRLRTTRLPSLLALILVLALAVPAGAAITSYQITGTFYAGSTFYDLATGGSPSRSRPKFNAGPSHPATSGSGSRSLDAWRSSAIGTRRDPMT